MLRRLRVDLALDRLVHFLTLHHQRRTAEVLVIVGKGRSSPGGEPVLGPAVRELCRRRNDLVLEVRQAPPEDGGDGAIVVRLRPPD
jgi:DNA-nicking Smr family endonuclease